MAETSLHTDQELLAAIANDSVQAFQELLARYQKVAYRTSMELFQDASVAEDIVQEVFLRVWLRRKKLAEVENFGGWLRTVTSNVLYTFIAKTKKEKEKADRWLKQLQASDIVQPPVTPEEAEFGKLLDEAVSKLPERQRAAFQLVKKSGYTRDQAAKELGISMETVKTHLELAMKSIRAYCVKRMDPLSAVVIFSIIFKKIW